MLYCDVRSGLLLRGVFSHSSKVVVWDHSQKGSDIILAVSTLTTLKEAGASTPARIVPLFPGHMFSVVPPVMSLLLPLCNPHCHLFKHTKSVKYVNITAYFNGNRMILVIL